MGNETNERTSRVAGKKVIASLRGEGEASNVREARARIDALAPYCRQTLANMTDVEGGKAMRVGRHGPAACIS
jgi:hypothetical protein